MTNKKITALTALTAPAASDVLAIIDLSEGSVADQNAATQSGRWCPLIWRALAICYGNIPAGLTGAYAGNHGVVGGKTKVSGKGTGGSKEPRVEGHGGSEGREV